MSWFEAKPADPFGVVELPYGVFALGDDEPRVGVAVGDRVLDAAAMAEINGHDAAPFRQNSLNAFMALGPAAWADTRALLQSMLADPTRRADVERHMHAITDLRPLMPFEVADYVDFYASEHHATNVGRMFRPDGEPLTPNWKHMPIGYHGRAGTVVVSGTDVVRPRGQSKAPAAKLPTFGPSRKLDIEAELGWVVGVGSEPGARVPVEKFRDHVFGVVILNDWSARDIQAWEYVPLGPFLGKSFATSISAWVLPLAALDDARVDLPEQKPELLPYLRGDSWGYDIEVEVELNGCLVSTCPYATMYYSPAQMLAHLSVNGAGLRTGDLYGSGTISGPGRDQRGSLLELGWNGSEPISLADGSSRAFLSDGDEVILRAVSPSHTGAVRLGEVRGRIQPSLTT
ncbi:MAG: fumarylacetoacetase [Propionibacteriaceae bacterium]|nr:fumarylacetoacetase [Propionibacteriaceae bacterium]